MIENGFNLDIKNPNVALEEHGDHVDILREYERIQAEAAATRLALKRELIASLGGGK